MTSPGIIHFTGDLEIDATVPRFPKVLPEVTWLTASATRVVAIGALTAPIFPAAVKSLSILDFVQQLDGRTGLENLLNCSGDLFEARHYFLRNLFQAGLLECGDGPGQLRGGPAAGLPAFLARTMDQTRLHNRRDQALNLMRNPIGVQDMAPEFVAMLREQGLIVQEATRGHPGNFALIGIRDDADQSADIDALLTRAQIVLPVRFHGAVLDIGPVLARLGGSHYEDYRHSLTAAPTPILAEQRHLLAALAVQMILLLNARTVPLQLHHNLLRFSITNGQPRTERLPLLRGQPLLATLGEACRARLTRQARIAVPSLDRVGTKAHEGHYSPENLAAAKELPVAIGQAASHSGTTAAGIQTAVLLEVLECAFGYRSIHRDAASRLCPTGGNLGSPECLVLVQRNAQAQILRYIPLQHQLELVHTGAAREASTVADSIHVICIGNREKTTRKYNEFGENLACIDAGVALAYFKNAAEVRGLRVTLNENAPIAPALDEVLALRTEYYRLMWTSQVSEAAPGPRLGSHLGALRKLDQRIAARKACRLYDGRDVDMKTVVKLLRDATPVQSQGLREQALAQLTVVIRNRSDQRYHLHALTADAGPSLLPVAPRDISLFMQTRLAEAPVQIFFLTPLHQVLARHGPEGHDASLSVAGEWVARLWLTLAENGLAGCPCGAVVEDDLLAQLPPQFARHFNLFAFVFGRGRAG